MVSVCDWSALVGAWPDYNSDRANKKPHVSGDVGNRNSRSCHWSFNNHYVYYDFERLDKKTTKAEDTEQMKSLKEFDYFKAWLLFFLASTVIAWLVGLMIGSFAAAFLGAARMPQPQMTRLIQTLGIVIAIAVSYVTFRAVVGKYLFPKLWDDDDTALSE